MRLVVLAVALEVGLSIGSVPELEPAARRSSQDQGREEPPPVRVGDVDRWKKLIRHSVDFFEQHAYHEPSGSYFSEIGPDGAVLSDVRHIVATSRMLYALAHASRIDSKYLPRARRLKAFLSRTMVARDVQGTPYFRVAVNAAGKTVVKQWDETKRKDVWIETAPDELAVHEQAYGLCGLVALYDVEPSAAALREIQVLYSAFRDHFKDRDGTGFFDTYVLPRPGRLGVPGHTKSFNSTVYVATAFLFELHDALGRVVAREDADAPHRELAREVHATAVADLSEIMDAVADKMVDRDGTGFIIELFDTDWNPAWRGWQWVKEGEVPESLGVVGHNFQAAWLLLRASRMPSVKDERAKRFADRAVSILRGMLLKPERGEGKLRGSPVDFAHGGFLDVFRREAGSPIYHTNKAWWQQAEGILALSLAERLHVEIAPNAGRVRDDALQFFVDHFVDDEEEDKEKDGRSNGEFAVVTRDGGQPQPREPKGHAGKSAYHTVELYRYLISYSGKD